MYLTPQSRESPNAVLPNCACSMSIIRFQPLTIVREETRAKFKTEGEKNHRQLKNLAFLLYAVQNQIHPEQCEDTSVRLQMSPRKNFLPSEVERGACQALSSTPISHLFFQLLVIPINTLSLAAIIIQKKREGGVGRERREERKKSHAPFMICGYIPMAVLEWKSPPA